MYIEMINKNDNRWLRYERDEMMVGGYDSTREGVKGVFIHGY
jgi:hypothetical protein